MLLYLFMVLWGNAGEALDIAVSGISTRTRRIRPRNKSGMGVPRIESPKLDSLPKKLKYSSGQWQMPMADSG